MSTSNLMNWPIFSFLDSNFISNIHMIFVYGDLGNEALIVTKDKTVYALGSNISGCLGIGDTNNAVHPKKVEELCNQSIRMFVHGKGPYVLALTEKGKVYSWGHNGRGQLGNGSTDSRLVPTLVSEMICNEFIVSIASGASHSLALTAGGNVFAWGDNSMGQLGCDPYEIVPVPTGVCGALDGKRVVCISCCQSSSVAVTDKGKVYNWGKDIVQNRRRCSGDNEGISPREVAGLNGIKIEKVVCGYSHVLALSDKGSLYVWGENNYGQLGINSSDFISDVSKLIVKNGAIVLDIAASHCNHISVAMVEGLQIFVWGECLGQSIRRPTLTNLQYLHDAFARFALHNVMSEPLVYDDYQKDVNVIDCLKEAFDNNTTCDLIIEVQERYIHVHKAVLMIRCEYFRKKLRGNNESVVKEEKFLYDAYRAFLKYLYTGEIDLDENLITELLEIACAYSENQLRKRCILIMQELEEYCFKYVLNHTSAVMRTERLAKSNEHDVESLIICEHSL